MNSKERKRPHLIQFQNTELLEIGNGVDGPMIVAIVYDHHVKLITQDPKDDQTQQNG
jgi:hypothetical protein